jgi:hypothetical protein
MSIAIAIYYLEWDMWVFYKEDLKPFTYVYGSLKFPHELKNSFGSLDTRRHTTEKLVFSPESEFLTASTSEQVEKEWTPSQTRC